MTKITAQKCPRSQYSMTMVSMHAEMTEYEKGNRSEQELRPLVVRGIH